MKQKAPFYMVDGHEVSATFQNEKNPSVVSSLKQALVASYINGKQNSVCTFASQEEPEYDDIGGNADAP